MRILLILCLLLFVNPVYSSDYGLRIKNTDSEFQIDGVNKNYVYVEGTDNVQRGATAGITNHNFSTNTTYPPIVLYRPLDGNRMGLLTLNYSAPNYTGFQMACGANANYDYRVFFLEDTFSSETHGMRIKNAKGELVYDTGYSTFRIIDVISTTNGTNVTHGADDNKVFYILTPWHCGVTGGHPAYTFRLVQSIYRVSSTQCHPQLLLDGIVGGHSVGSQVSGTNIDVIVCEFDD